LRRAVLPRGRRCTETGRPDHRSELEPAGELALQRAARKRGSCRLDLREQGDRSRVATLIFWG
jgi:hypothetical protein